VKREHGGYARELVTGCPRGLGPRSANIARAHVYDVAAREAQPGSCAGISGEQSACCPADKTTTAETRCETFSCARNSRRTHAHICLQGTRYHGLQMATQPNIPTVEAEVHRALHASGAISDSNNGDRSKVKWSSASRTDKGVHAAACVCTVKLLVPPSDDVMIPRATLDAWNANLPPDIRILAALRAPKNGRAHSMCSLREYEYLLPQVESHARAKGDICYHASSRVATLANRVQLWLPFTPRCMRRTARYSPECAPHSCRSRQAQVALHGKPVADIRRLLKKFEGTHRFHNFAGRLSLPKRGNVADSDEEMEVAGASEEDGACQQGDDEEEGLNEAAGEVAETGKRGAQAARAGNRGSWVEGGKKRRRGGPVEQVCLCCVSGARVRCVYLGCAVCAPPCAACMQAHVFMCEHARM
jgi:tRNA pseudouridine(38-40) synthase